MLHRFLEDNRSELIELCRAKVARRLAPRESPAQLEHGIPLFLDQLTDMMAHADRDPIRSAPTPESPSTAAEMEIDHGARQHGGELLHQHFTVDQVVHAYGDLCQSITELAVRKAAPITVHEFGVLNIRLDNAIAGAVTEFARQREVHIGETALAVNERLGVLAHEMRNLLNTTILAVSAIKGGGVGFGGATSAALDRSLLSMRALIDRTLTEVAIDPPSKS